MANDAVVGARHAVPVRGIAFGPCIFSVQEDCVRADFSPSLLNSHPKQNQNLHQLQQLQVCTAPRLLISPLSATLTEKVGRGYTYSPSDFIRTNDF
jgi:hypothetical protein